MAGMFLKVAAIIVVMTSGTAVTAAQHEGHVTAGMPQTAGAGADAAQVSACVQSQEQVMVAADAANRRLDLARQSNQPAAMRAAMDDLQSVLSSMRTQLASCAHLKAAAAPAAGATAPGPGAVGPAAPAGAADPHAGHVIPPPPPAATPAPKPSTPAAAAAPRPTMVMVQTAFDPIKLTCSPKIDPKAAAKTTYQGKTYYFCSAKDRDEFLTDPAMSLSMMPPTP